MITENNPEKRVLETVCCRTDSVLEAIRNGREKSGETNSSGENTLKADVKANKILVEELKDLDCVGQIVSEEEAQPVNSDGKLAVAIDPLDGSSNIPTNNIVGTIFGVYEEKIPCKASQITAAGYIVYGPLTTVTYTEGDQVERYIIEQNSSPQKTENITINSSPTYYGFGGTPSLTQDIAQLASDMSKNLKLRYSGALVGDFNRVLQEGGIISYPWKKGMKNGKYRAFYEAVPLAKIMDAAGGRSSDGENRILDKEFNNVHSRTPFFSGNKSIVKEAERKTSRP